MANNGKIYALVDPDSLQIRYIGKTIRRISDRFREHLKGDNGENAHVVRWIVKLASEGKKPLVTILEEDIPVTDLDLKERDWIRKAKEAGYPLTNLTPGGEYTPGWEQDPEMVKRRVKGREKLDQERGYHHSPETIEKIRQWNIGRKMPKEAVEKIAQSRRGKKLSPEHKAKISKGLMGNPGHKISEEHQRKMLEARGGTSWNKGKPLSEERKAHLSRIMTGRTQPEEVRRKISATEKGRVHSKEAIQKMKAAKMGHLVTLETRAKISATKAVKFNPSLNWDEEYQKALKRFAT